MSEILSQFLDSGFTDWVFSLVSLVPAGLVLALVAWAFGFAVAWFIRFIQRLV